MLTSQKHTGFALLTGFITALLQALLLRYCCFTAALLLLYSGIVGKSILDEGQSESDRVSLSLCSSLSLSVSLSLCASLSLVSGRVSLSLCPSLSHSVSRSLCLSLSLVSGRVSLSLDSVSVPPSLARKRWLISW